MKYLCFGNRILGVVLAFSLSVDVLANQFLWSELGEDGNVAAGAERKPAESGQVSRQLRIDRQGLKRLINEGGNSPERSFTLALPAPDGSYRRFEFRSASTMSPGLAKKFPNIMAFSGRSLDGGVVSAQLEVTPSGVSAQVLTPKGRWMIDPSDKSDASKVKSFYPSHARRKGAPFQCGVTGLVDRSHPLDKRLRSTRSSKPKQEPQHSKARGAEFRTYRLAVATTGEYSEYHGGSVDDALSAVVKVVNRVNGIFNSELAVGFELIEDNDQIIFTDAETDPFEGNFDTEILIDESQTVIDEVIGSENYDIGHTFGGDGGGMASTGPCQEGYKASGVTGGTEGDAFAVDYVAHEIGHQFGMDHTFNTNADDCLANRYAPSAFEPGAGSTIMSYNGVCSPDNIAQAHLSNNSSDPIFHSYSFEQAAAYLEGVGASCGVATDTGNTHPSVDAGGSYVVPALTPLYVEGAASDPDGGSVTYSWEQRDLGPAAALSARDDGAIPLFRTYAPLSSVRRYLPQLEKVVSGDYDDTEKMPRVARTMAFALTARDEAGGRSSDATQIEVIAAPLVGKTFAVAEPNLGGSLGKVATVRWHVGETVNEPILARQVELYLSTDGGKNFSSEPLLRTANDGYARVEFPSGVQTDAARIMVKGYNNIFYDVSDANFSLDSSAAATPEVPAPVNVSGAKSGGTSIDIAFSPGSGRGVDYYDAVCIGEPSLAAVSGSQSPSADFDTAQSAVSAIGLDAPGTISPDGLSVAVDITHGYRGDVILKLTAPSGNSVNLKDYDAYDQADDVVDTYLVRGVAGEPIAGDWQLEVSDGWEDDFNGRLNSWSISGTAVLPPRIVEGSKAPEASFDNDTFVSSSIQLSAAGEVSPDEFEVAVDITHSWRSDVVIELEAPSGKRIALRREESDDSGDDVRGTYPTTLRSVTSFSELAGERLSGSWTLHVSDQAAGDDGVLNSWGIRQSQYFFTGGGTRSPITVTGLPTNQSYDCSIAGVFSDVLPPRQSESVSAGRVALGDAPVASQSESRFLSLLQTVLGLDSTASADPGRSARLSDSGSPDAENKEDSVNRPANAIPTLGAHGTLLLSLVLMAIGWSRVRARSR